MPNTKPKFYVTTPIYYVNARPHIGHAYTTIVADVVARRRRLLGDDVWFLTGTDEHGQKIERAAKAAGVSPQKFADDISAQFKGLWKRMGITNNDYIRTTEPHHKKGVQKLFKTLQDKGFIYKATYTGQYCVSDEAFVDVPVGAPCPDCGRITETVSEENYYFKLSEFQKPLLDYYAAHPEFIAPDGVRNEVLSFVRGGAETTPGALKDLSISRTSFDWGIPVPGDEKHVIYVWLDALANYMTAIGYGSDAPEEKKKFEKYWPADLHLVGKEITRFHCVYWPAFLMAAGLPLPKKIQAHGWLLFEESKMSKSRGNIVRAETILDAFGSLKPEVSKEEQDLFGSDVLRYFLLREIPFGQDGSFNFDALLNRYNAELANEYGNLVSRVLTMIASRRNGVIPIPSNRNMPTQYGDVRVEIAVADARIASSDATWSTKPSTVAAYWSGNLTLLNRYFTNATPWKLSDDDAESRQKVDDILYAMAEALRTFTAIIHPILPYSTKIVWTQLGLGDIKQAAKEGQLKRLDWGKTEPGTKLGALGPIFPRADKELINVMNEMEQNNAPAAEPAVAAPATPAEKQFISIDDVMKVELRVAEIKVAERIPKSDKLLRLEVDLGTEARQILAGIAEHYAPETLIGRRVIIVANLAPRKMRGLESQGMLLAASLGDADKPSIAGFLDSVELGARVRIFRILSKAEDASRNFMYLVDSHAHLDSDRYDADRAAMLTNAWSSGVRAVLSIGIGDGPHEMHRALEIAHEFAGKPETPVIYASTGIHPQEAHQVDAASLAKLAQLAADPKCIAIGEIGLDYYHLENPEIAIQKKAFIAQMEVAAAAKLPILLHIRTSELATPEAKAKFGAADAWKDTLELLEAHWRPTGLGGVMHCFSGDVAEAKRSLDLGFLLSFAGNLTYPKAQGIRDAAVFAPLASILVETDAPFLAPIPNRGQRNEPAWVTHTAAHLAEIRKTTPETIAEATTANFHRLFSRTRPQV